MISSTRLMVLALTLALAISPAAEAKKKKNEEAAKPSPIAKPIRTFTGEDKAIFDALSKEQQTNILNGKIEKGYNAWMVRAALGDSYYETEHHPKFVDYEEVWLYTKPEVIEKKNEEQIIDPTNNWPTIHRKIEKKTCTVGNFFVLWDRGVVDSIRPANERKVYGSCTITHQEAYLPIVNGKPVEPKQ